MQNRYIYIILLSFVTQIGISQTDVKDLESWTSISINYKLNKKWHFELEEQLRFKDNISVVDGYFTELNIEYIALKRFDFGGGIRFLRKNDTKGKIQGYENHFRFHLDASYKYKINRLSLKHRLRYQNKNELGLDDFPNQRIRFKTSLAYNIRKWKLDPKFTTEIFNRFQKDKNDGFDKYRLTIGTDYKLFKTGKIGLFYRVEKEINVSSPKTTNILGLKFNYTIKN